MKNSFLLSTFEGSVYVKVETGNAHPVSRRFPIRHFDLRCICKFVIFQRQFRVSSTIFSRYHNVTRPSTFPQLLTQVITLDISKNRTEFRANIKEILERGTKGHLENEMLPKKDAAWKEIFDNATHGVYVNTLHYKSAWDRPWTEIGERNFFDGVSIPFIESPQGEYLYAEGDNATAVVVDIQVASPKLSYSFLEQFYFPRWWFEKV